MFLFLFFLFPQLVHSMSYDLLAPFSGPTTITSLGDYLNLIFTVAIGVTGILAVLMIVICGIRLMGSPSPSAREEAKKCIVNAVIGIVLAFSSWIILYTINPEFLSTSDTWGVVNTNVVTSASPAPSPTVSYSWETAPFCPAITGKIASIVSSSFCAGPQPPGTVCCGYTNSPLTPPAGGPLVPLPPAPPPPSLPPSTVSLSASSYIVVENAGILSITINRSSGVGAGTVDYKIIPKSAHNGTDYTGTTGTVSFALGQTVQTISIPIINDTVHENIEDFGVTLLNPTGAIGLGGIRSASVTIKDDDPVTAVVRDTHSPILTISYPYDGFATTSTSIMLSFMASDNIGIDSISFLYVPPPADVWDAVNGVYISVSTPVSTQYCGPGGCSGNPITYNAPFAIDTTKYGVHTIQVKVCDRENCTQDTRTVYVQRPCISQAGVITCKTLPSGKGPITNPICGEPPSFVFPPNNGSLSVPWTSPYANGANWKPLSNGYIGVTVGVTTDSYEFEVKNWKTGGGDIIVLGGNQPEYPVPKRMFQGQCPDQWKPYCEPILGNPDFASPDCLRCRKAIQDEMNGITTGYQWSGGAVYSLPSWGGFSNWSDWLNFGMGWGPIVCPDNIVYRNVLVSISDEPGDLASDSNTIAVKGKALAGYCGNADSLGLGSEQMHIKIMATTSALTVTPPPGVCMVQLDRKYYVNISTALPGNEARNMVTGTFENSLPVNDAYSLLWNWSPF